MTNKIFHNIIATMISTFALVLAGISFPAIANADVIKENECFPSNPELWPDSDKGSSG